MAVHEPMAAAGLAEATGLRVRRERAEDEPFLRALYRTTRDHEPGLAEWPAAARTAFLDQQCDAQRSGHRREFPRADRWILEIAEGRVDAPVGRLHVDLRDDEIRIIDVALVPDVRNGGIGTRILGWVTGEARRRGIPVRMHVGIFNPAVRLYERLGFRRMAGTGAHHLLEWSG